MRLHRLASPRSTVFHCLAAALAVLAFAPAAAATEPTRPEARPASRYAERGLLGPVRLGPVIGVGFPDGLTFGVHAKLAGWAALGLQGGWVPETKLPIAEDARVVRVSGEVFARIHPFRAGFFLGCGIGAAQMKGSVFTDQKAFGQIVDARARAFVRSVYVSPQIGYQWMLGRSVSASIDVGVQIPIAPGDPTFDASSLGLVQPLEATGKLADAMRVTVRSPVPTVNLLRLGVLL